MNLKIFRYSSSKRIRNQIKVQSRAQNHMKMQWSCLLPVLWTMQLHCSIVGDAVGFRLKNENRKSDCRNPLASLSIVSKPGPLPLIRDVSWHLVKLPVLTLGPQVRYQIALKVSTKWSIDWFFSIQNSLSRLIDDISQYFSQFFNVGISSTAEGEMSRI